MPAAPWTAGPDTASNRLIRDGVALPLTAAPLLGATACSSDEELAWVTRPFGELETPVNLEERVGVLEEEFGI